MNDSERRRKELLELTRQRYSDSTAPPAVHPRYHAVYEDLYGTEDELPGGTLGIRTFFCILLFAVFLSMDHNHNNIWNVSSENVVEAVTSDMDIQESLEVLR